MDVFESARRVWVCAALCPCVSSRGGGGGRGMVEMVGVSRSEAGKARACVGREVLSPEMCEICIFMREQVKFESRVLLRPAT